MVDFHRHRALVRANTAFIEGIALEPIPPSVSGFCPGMVLIDRFWKHVYFLEERKNWIDNDYFEYAKKLMLLKCITKP